MKRILEDNSQITTNDATTVFELTTNGATTTATTTTTTALSKFGSSTSITILVGEHTHLFMFFKIKLMCF